MVTCCVISLLVARVATGQSPVTRAGGERLSLETAVRLAVENNRQLQTARLQIESAEADLAATRTRRLPAFDVELMGSQLLMPVDFSFPQAAFGTIPGIGPVPLTDTTFSVPRQPTMYVFTQASQPISQLFKIGLGVSNAEKARDIARERARGEQLSIVNNVKRLYFAILQTQSALTATNEAIALYRELDKTLQVRVAQKVALRSDALDVQLHLAQEELTLTSAQNLLASQREQLNQLLGRDVRTAFEIEDVTGVALQEGDPDASLARALENRPDLREARMKVEHAELDRRLTKADRIPEISVAVSYTSNFNIDVLPANLAVLGVQFKWEPFDWGRNSHEVASKQKVVDQARLAVRDAEDRAAIDINNRYRTLAEKRAQLNVARMAQESAREQLRVKTNLFKVQAALLPDVLQLRAGMANADDEYQRALVAFWTAKADYDLALGEEVLR
jgi:outer membrane protein TolC